MFMSPATSSLWLDGIVPIPTLPALFILMTSDPFEVNPKFPSAGKYRPVSVSVAKANPGVVELPGAPQIEPLNVTSPLDEMIIRTPLLVSKFKLWLSFVPMVILVPKELPPMLTLLLKLFQSVMDRYPSEDVPAAGRLMLGVVVGVVTDNGAEALTEVTLPPVGVAQLNTPEPSVCKT